MFVLHMKPKLEIKFSAIIQFYFRFLHNNCCLRLKFLHFFSLHISFGALHTNELVTSLKSKRIGNTNERKQNIHWTNAVAPLWIAIGIERTLPKLSFESFQSICLSLEQNKNLLRDYGNKTALWSLSSFSKNWNEFQTV